MNNENAKKGSVKNTILIIVSVILLVYAFIIAIVPIKFNDALKNKEIIPELEKLTQLKIDYDYGKMKITPTLDVVVKFTNFKAEKKDVDQKVLSVSSATLVFNPLMLVSKNYIMKACQLNGVDYYEVLDNGVPEIKTFLLKYSLLSTAGGPYSITTSPIEIRYYIKHSYDSTTGRYYELKRKELNLEAEPVANFIDVVSQGGVKAKS